MNMEMCCSTSGGIGFSDGGTTVAVWHPSVALAMILVWDHLEERGCQMKTTQARIYGKMPHTPPPLLFGLFRVHYPKGLTF